jgi:hypothetical protein
MKRLLIFGAIILLGSTFVKSQSIIEGTVTSEIDNQPIEFVTVYLQGTSVATETNTNGKYRLEVPSGQAHTLVFSRIGFAEKRLAVGALAVGQSRTVTMAMGAAESDFEVVVEETKLDQSEMVRESVEELKLIPSTTGNFESILPSIALGTSGGTGGELSSQYNVRGGNYDENLVYVNDFEIFRPQLIRNSQQEGLSFPNPDLISNISFSSGGFQARYGDKISSVLDVQYKRPEQTKGSVSASLLGLSAHLEGSKDVGASNYKKFRYLLGARYKTNRYLLGTLDTEGQYTPNFVDIQTYLTYDLTKDVQLGVIANYNQSQFDFIPNERNTAFGSFFTTLRLSSLFEGQERDDYRNGMGGMSLTYIPERDKNPLFLKLLGSVYGSDESETFDIQSFYSLSQVETGLGDEAGEDLAIIGTGTQHEFARNNLQSSIVNLRHNGGVELQLDSDGEAERAHFLQWGIQYQREQFDDELNEWQRLDSAGFSLPFDPEVVNLFEVTKSNNNISSNRFRGFIQDSYSVINSDRYEFRATVGTRFAYWDLNEEFLISPRVQLLYKPLAWDKDISFKLAGGVYYQSPFYRELRRPDGSLNLNLKSQRSIHAVAGFTFDFGEQENSNRKKYRFITEAYYKKLDNLISYEIDNIRIRYSGENDASGYVAGIDFRINGELVPGVDSWLNVSFLGAKETIDDVQHLRFFPGDSTSTQVNFVPRPTDQLFSMSLFFQDYLPQNENFKMHLNLVYGSGLPFGVEGDNRIFRNTFQYKSYQRVDIGFSLALWNRDNENKKNLFSWSNGAWVSLEVFNLLGIDNVASNTWIRAIFNQQYAIPNNLTSRRLNLKFRLEF